MPIPDWLARRTVVSNWSSGTVVIGCWGKITHTDWLKCTLNSRKWHVTTNAWPSCHINLPLTPLTNTTSHLGCERQLLCITSSEQCVLSFSSFSLSLSQALCGRFLQPLPVRSGSLRFASSSFKVTRSANLRNGDVTRSLGSGSVSVTPCWWRNVHDGALAWVYELRLRC